jgi:hypothetical protein
MIKKPNILYLFETASGRTVLLRIMVFISFAMLVAGYLIILYLFLV